jgi:Family of unknown function (DUF6524)
MMAGLLLRWTFFPRLLFALALVFGTYNPEKPYSYYYWAIANLPDFSALKAFVGVVLLIGWTIYISATIEALGGLGLLLAAAFFGTATWAVIDQGWLQVEDPRVLTYVVLVLISALLATGLGWSTMRRRITGQVDVNEIDHR